VELVRHGPTGFLGEVNLLSGQTVFVTAVATEPMRYVAVEREELRQLLNEDGALADLLLSAFVERREMLQQRAHVGIGIVGSRASADTRRLLDYARAQRLPYTWEETGPDAAQAPPVVRLPEGLELSNPRNGELSRALGIGLELTPREEVDLLIVGGGP